MNFTMRTLALPVVTAATALALAACGSSSAGNPGQNMPGMPGMNSSSGSASTSAPAGTAASGPHNPADVTFAAGMIPHHQQAITMAQMALTQATNPEVKKLATAIKAAQDPEIQTMSGWLTGWGQPVPATTGATHDMSQMGSPTSDAMGDMGGMGGMDGTGGMSGMMSDKEMSQLSATSGAAFDKLWLQMMVKHHQGAVAMARTELTDGANTEAKQLAQSIIDSQSTEITTMTTLLATLGS